MWRRVPSHASARATTVSFQVYAFCALQAFPALRTLRASSALGCDGPSYWHRVLQLGCTLRDFCSLQCPQCVFSPSYIPQPGTYWFNVICDNTCTLNLALMPIFISPFLKFLLSGPHKSTVLDFLKFGVFDFSGILFVFVNMRPYGSQNFKTLLIPQISFESFQTFSEISSQWSWQKYCFGFLKFWVFDFSGILFVFTNIGPNGSLNF